MATKDCFGTYNFASAICSTCDENVKCVDETMFTEACYVAAIDAGECKVDSPMRHNCPDYQSKKCFSVRNILAKRRRMPCYATIPNKIDCLRCMYYESCYIAFYVADDLSRNEMEATFHYEKELQKAREDEETPCFGEFGFADECWEGCDFVNQCRKETGIMPDGACRNFFKIPSDPKTMEELPDIDLAFNIETCGDCREFSVCKPLLSDQIHHWTGVIQKRSIYTSFLTKEELRGRLVRMEEDDD